MNLSIESLINVKAHLGDKKIKRNPYQSSRILAYKNGKDIINVEETIQDLIPVLNIITETIANREQILVIAQNSSLNVNDFPQPIITQKWLYGALSNFKTTKSSQKNIVKQIPNVIIILQTNTADLLLNEAKFLEIPTITVQQSSDSPLKSQYTIVTNSKNTKTLEFFLQLFTKAAYAGYAKQILKFKQKQGN